jgi:hypothetical protein
MPVTVRPRKRAANIKPGDTLLTGFCWAPKMTVSDVTILPHSILVEFESSRNERYLPDQWVYYEITG